jgi:hypothetical protein
VRGRGRDGARREGWDADLPLLKAAVAKLRPQLARSMILRSMILLERREDCVGVSSSSLSSSSLNSCGALVSCAPTSTARSTRSLLGCHPRRAASRVKSSQAKYLLGQHRKRRLAQHAALKSHRDLRIEPALQQLGWCRTVDRREQRFKLACKPWP